MKVPIHYNHQKTKIHHHLSSVLQKSLENKLLNKIIKTTVEEIIGLSQKIKDSLNLSKDMENNGLK